ncbi:hypothetical protein QNO00_16845 [Arthrobacter sp. zg-Y1219]|uniref:hypothetical protein n=1 Tax=Arthrobacter sp. zg-Y1219 TaxID=3049067 RepID=UPI0024C27FA8|nr:hypothetical protein [Arthrobacter sp. zg-Y1219]MDK1361921.1 hypothetical protein [Arthrobacter sp. zg-Y1219]
MTTSAGRLPPYVYALLGLGLAAVLASCIGALISIDKAEAAEAAAINDRPLVADIIRIADEAIDPETEEEVRLLKADPAVAALIDEHVFTGSAWDDLTLLNTEALDRRHAETSSTLHDKLYDLEGEESRREAATHVAEFNEWVDAGHSANLVEAENMLAVARTVKDTCKLPDPETAAYALDIGSTPYPPATAEGVEPTEENRKTLSIAFQFAVADGVYHSCPS